MKNNMYSLSVKSWNPYVGCFHACVYCESSFQRQLKRWAKGHCQQCYDFTPHFHKERLTESLPKTNEREFIFVCANGDWAFALSDWRKKILQRIRQEPNKTFLIQSKNPKIFRRDVFPNNVILGTTIETNYPFLYFDISKSPLPLQRAYDFSLIQHARKMLTFEPIIDFDIPSLILWTNVIKPEMVWVGYDSKHNYLPEPELARTKAFIEELEMRGYYIVTKLLRSAWWENG